MSSAVTSIDHSFHDCSYAAPRRRTHLSLTDCTQPPRAATQQPIRPDEAVPDPDARSALESSTSPPLSRRSLLRPASPSNPAPVERYECWPSRLCNAGVITTTTCRSSYSAAASPPRQKVTPRRPGHTSRITFGGHRARAETTIKIELNLELAGRHPERGDLRASTCSRRQQLSCKYSAGRSARPSIDGTSRPVAQRRVTCSTHDARHGSRRGPGGAATPLLIMDADQENPSAHSAIG